MLFQLVTVFGGRRLSCCFSTVTTSLVSASAFKVFEVNLNKKGYQSFCNKWDLFSAILICIDSKFDSLTPTLTSPIKVNESQCIALFAVSGSIKKLFQSCQYFYFSRSIIFANIHLFSIFFISIDFARWKSVALPHIAYVTPPCLYSDSYPMT